MKKYYVEVPVVMKLMVEVKAESEEDAVEKIFNGDITIDVKDGKENLEYIDYEWDMYEKVVQGNVYYGGINEMDIEEIEDDEE